MKIAQLALLASFAGLVAAAPRADAQIGGLVKKAKDAATAKKDSVAHPNSSSNTKPSSAFGPELTASSLDAVLRGATAAQEKLDLAEQLRNEERQVSAKADAASRGHDKERESYDASVQKHNGCWGDEWQRVTAAEQDKLRQRMMTDPTFVADMQKKSMEQARKMADLQSKGDTAGMRKLAMESTKNMAGIDIHADSETVKKKCGAGPAKPAFMVEEEAAHARSRQLDEHARALQDSTVIVGMAASGMGRQEYTLARERIVNWLHEARGGSALQQFGGEERKLLEAKKAQIMKLSKAFS